MTPKIEFGKFNLMLETLGKKMCNWKWALKNLWKTCDDALWTKKCASFPLRSFLRSTPAALRALASLGSPCSLFLTPRETAYLSFTSVVLRSSSTSLRILERTRSNARYGYEKHSLSCCTEALMYCTSLQQDNSCS